NLQEQILLRPQKIVAIASQHINENLNVERIRADAYEAHWQCSWFDTGMTGKNLGDRVQDDADLIGRGVAPQIQSHVKQHLVAFLEVLQGHRRELTIGHADHRAIQRSNSSGTQSDVLDGSHQLA